jgi:hypothetical protein
MKNSAPIADRPGTVPPAFIAWVLRRVPAATSGQGYPIVSTIRGVTRGDRDGREARGRAVQPEHNEEGATQEGEE